MCSSRYWPCALNLIGVVMDKEKLTHRNSARSSHKEEHFDTVWRRFQNSTPNTYRRISLEVSRLVFGPELPEKAFDDLDALQNWYRAVLHSWLCDSLRV